MTRSDLSPRPAKKRNRRPAASLGRRPANARQLHAWVQAVTGLSVPRKAHCPGHAAPFDYLRASFFEEPDLLVWAGRGGGKTTLAALACLLDALFKAPLTAAVLGGSFEQADRLAGTLRRLLEPHEQRLGPRWVRERLELGEATLLTLAQSERAVRGLRVQRLRCDELDLFDPSVWRAAQFVTRSTDTARASLEVFSTLHRAGGLMDGLVAAVGGEPRSAAAGEGAAAASAPGKGFRLLRWCLWEVIERCGPERSCSRCPLDADCRGVARRAEGFFGIDDAIAIRARVSRAAWESEMLCRRPRADGLVFEEFRRERHVRPCAYRADWPLYRAIDFGYANPFVCLWMQVSPGGGVQVLDEYVRQRRSIAAHAGELLDRERRCGWRPPAATYVDPAGRAHEVATGQACTEMLAAEGIWCTSRRSPLGDGLELIRQHLAPAEGPPRLAIDPRCGALIRSFETYAWARGSGVPAKDGADHAIDALRYFFVNRLAPRPGVQRRGY